MTGDDSGLTLYLIHSPLFFVIPASFLTLLHKRESILDLAPGFPFSGE